MTSKTETFGTPGQTEPPLLDTLASLARTALSDPDGLPEAPRPWTNLNPDDPTLYSGQGYDTYAIDRLDDIIEALNPSTETMATMAATLTMLGRHLAERADYLEATTEDDAAMEARRDEAVSLIHAALDSLDQAIEVLR